MPIEQLVGRRCDILKNKCPGGSGLHMTRSADEEKVAHDLTYRAKMIFDFGNPLGDTSLGRNYEIKAKIRIIAILLNLIHHCRQHCEGFAQALFIAKDSTAEPRRSQVAQLCGASELPWAKFRKKPGRLL